MDELMERARAYPVTVVPDEHEGYIASMPDFPTVFTSGETPEEALANAYEGIALALEWYIETNTPAPRPTLVAPVR